ncbi:ADP-ribosylation/Crystallin J1 [Gymnopilus junonius]|uniref:ADP-ribosylhydrolase ARH3 n=1 Tax=Gymnopilus junonius TaxID=109634 RepID=A0A9P5NEC3_GYMJU|nr:ADP-ribosylation/Crystallin J1 [Gymnopilus junonius]
MPPKFWASLKSKGKSSSSSSTLAPDIPLHAQFPTKAPVETKIRCTMLATAMLDALAAPMESHKRFTFPFLDSMLPNENFKEETLPPGVWTDDTSLSLCLANSMSTMKETRDATFIGGFDEVHQLRVYRRWYRECYLCCAGKQWHNKTDIRSALQMFTQFESDPEQALHRIRENLGGDKNDTNGSLIRIAPVGLAYWHDEVDVKYYAKRNSQATHPSTICMDACEAWAACMSLVMQEVTPTEPRRDRFGSELPRLTKLTLVEFLSRYPFTSNSLRAHLTVPFGAPPIPQDIAERERYFFQYHPLLRLMEETQSAAAKAGRPEASFPYNIPTAEQLPSTNYVVDTIVCAFYCFLTTKTFEEGALMAVNLGHNSCSVAVVYAALAALWYSAEEGPKPDVTFWSKRVKEWRDAVLKRDLIEEVIGNLIIWEDKIARLT